MGSAVISMLLLLLGAAVLLGYYFSSSCVHGVACGDGSCVWRSDWCNGVQDCPGGQDEAACVRLHGSSLLLQIFSSEGNSWRSVCSQGWTDRQGRATCQYMGYSKSTYSKWKHQTADSGSDFLKVKPGSRPDAPIMQQLVQSTTCPNNSVVSLHCNECGARVSSGRSPEGQQAVLGAWPWQASLWAGGSHRCGGSIIDPYWIVTAAHCVSGKPEDWLVYCGIVDPLGTVFNPGYSVSHIVTHEGYNRLTLKNDIAMVKLSRPLDFTVSRNIGPVCLPNAGLNITDSQEIWTSGFCNQVNNTTGSPYLMEAQVSILEAAVCNLSVSYGNAITQDMICAAAIERGVCDSGSPVVSHKDGVWWLLGHYSWGDLCVLINKPGVYGNITYFLSWIHHQMQNYQDFF